MTELGQKVIYERAGKRYSLLSDLHTHTTYSHGKGSVRDNVEAARAKGIMKIGISDHGPANILFGIKRSSLPLMRADVETLRSEYPDMEILLGVEANIEGGEGVLDVTAEDLEYYDYIAAGYHYGTFGGGKPVGLLRGARNIISGILNIAPRGLVRSNTESIVQAVEKNDLLFVTHPGDKAPVDFREVAEACKRKGTLIELNTSARHRCISPEQLRLLAGTGVGFIVSSDAHTAGRVGDFVYAIDLIIKSGIDPLTVKNISVD